MKASELIVELKRQVKLHGDLQCILDDDYGGLDINGVRVTDIYGEEVFLITDAV